MRLSSAERERRSKVIAEKMQREDIDALLVLGDAVVVSSRGTGSFRYMTDFFLYANYSLLLFFPQSEPVLFVSSENSFYWASKRSCIRDVRRSTQMPVDAVKVLNERIREGGRLGLVSRESFPPHLFLYLQRHLKGWKLIDADMLLFDVRFAKSAEEQRLIKKSAEIMDESFQAVQKMIKPGIKEYEIGGYLDGFHRGNGCEQTFNLISSGPFPGTGDERFPTLPASPSDREIRKGDVICLEVTAAYMGYWTQVVREVSLGENRELAAFHRALVKTVEAGANAMKPGSRTQDFVASMEACATKEGFKLTPPMGHYVGLNLTEAPVSPENGFVLRSGSTVILHPCLADEKGIRVFWGETYLIGENEALCLHKASKELVVL